MAWCAIAFRCELEGTAVNQFSKELHEGRRPTQIPKGIHGLDLIERLLVLLIELFLDKEIVAVRPHNMPKNRYESRAVQLLMKKARGLTGEIIGFQGLDPVFTALQTQLILCKPA